MAKIGKQPKDDSAFGVRMVILQIVKAASQGFAELTVPAGLSGPFVRARAVACFAVLWEC